MPATGTSLNGGVEHPPHFMSAYRPKRAYRLPHCSGAKMLNALILVPTVLAALSFTFALQSPTKLASGRTQKTEAVRSQLITVITDLNLQANVALCLIGFLLILYFILRFPDLGSLIEQYNQF
jgi:hypothetical protein